MINYIKGNVKLYSEYMFVNFSSYPIGVIIPFLTPGGHNKTLNNPFAIPRDPNYYIMVSHPHRVDRVATCDGGIHGQYSTV